MSGCGRGARAFRPVFPAIKPPLVSRAALCRRQVPVCLTVEVSLRQIYPTICLPPPPEPGVQIPHAARPSRRVTAQPYAPLTVRDRGRRLSSAQPAHATRPIISTGAMSARWPPNAHPYHHTSRVSIGLGAFSILHRWHGANQSGIPSSLPYPVSPYLANNIVE